jgi:predicted phosphodiesterase
MKTFIKILIIGLLFGLTSCIYKYDTLVDIPILPDYDQVMLVVGDTRPGFGNKDFETTEKVINDALSYTIQRFRKIDGIIQTGDYVSSGRITESWEGWKKANKYSFQYPIYPAIGNHDDERKSCEGMSKLDCFIMTYKNSNYYKTFGYEDWWSKDVGQLHLTSFSSNFDDDEPDIVKYQQIWLEEDMNKNKDTNTIVIFHAPIYASRVFKKGHGPDIEIRNYYEHIILKQGNVKLIINGHNHWYERVYVNGITHITVGGGGAPLLPPIHRAADKAKDVDGNIVTKANVYGYGYVVLAIKNNIMYGWAIHYKTHKLMDTFQIKLN